MPGLCTAVMLAAVNLARSNVAIVSPAQDTRPAASRLDFRTSPIVALHFLVRKLAEPPAEGAAAHAPASGPTIALTQADAYLAPAVAACRKLDAELGGGLAWGVVEGTLSGCRTAADAAAALDQLPATATLRSGKAITLQPAARELGAAYVALEAQFLRDTWPRHEATLASSREKLEKMLDRRQADCLAHICRGLALEDPRIVIPVYLLAVAPAPGGFTHRARGGGAVCFVEALSETAADQIAETVLHEAIHAFDVASASQNTALQALREALRAGGIGPTEPLYRDVPHTLMFVQSAQTVRACLDPAHRDYGDVSGYYAKVPAAARIVRKPWTDYLTGKLERDQALKKIVTATKAENP
jgi:hypothetical protein